MKLPTYAILAAALACGFASATTTAYTTPVGYETQTLLPGIFNLVGVRLFSAPVAAGVFSSSTSTTLVDSNAAFNLNSTTNYIVEFANGTTEYALGSQFSGTTLSGLTGVNASLQIAYVVRPATTISGVFGATNTAGIASSANADPTEADIVYLPNGALYTRIFYSTYTDDMAYNGWLDADTFAQVPNQVIDPLQGMFVQTAHTVGSLNLVTTGEIKKTPTAYSVPNHFTLLGSMYPAGATLTTSGLSSSVQASANADPTEADVILLPNGTGLFVRAFYSTYTDDMAYNGWLDADTFAQIPNQALTPAYFIQKATGVTYSGLNLTPSFYSGL